ncbi:MAG TPA: calcium-binding protein [Tepidisphaeraceae bacterium]|nr:calcium-binding protein [Tepidisphaeraceae bacterium]
MRQRKKTAFLLEWVEPRLYLSVNSWKNAVSGDWDTASNWSLGHVPLATEDVQITVPGTYTVTHSTGDDSCASITSDAPLVISGGALDVSGDVQVNNTFTISGGTLEGATVEPGSGGQGITASGINQQSLTDVTLLANVSIPNDSTLTADGVTLSNSTVTIASTGQTAELALASGSTLGGSGTVTFSSSDPADEELFASNSSPVIIGKNITIGGSGGQFNVIYDDPAFINDGTIDSAVSGQTMTINGEMDNLGTIEAQGGGGINMTSSWINESSGTMSVTGGGTLTIGPRTTTPAGPTGNNAGTISMNASTLILGANFTNTGTISRSGGAVDLVGIYNLNGGSRTLASADGSYVLEGGGVENGTLTFSGGGTLVPTATTSYFDNLTLGSSLTVGDGCGIQTDNLTLTSGTTVTLASAGSGAGINMAAGSFIDGPGSVLFAGADPAGDYIGALNGASVSFGPGLTISGAGGSFVTMYDDTFDFINFGTIDCNVSGQTMNVGGGDDGGNMDNFGTLEATDGGSINLHDEWTNQPGDNMSVTGGGTLTLGPPSDQHSGQNSGTISETDSTLNLGGYFTSSGTVASSGGTVNITGLYDLNGGTLALSSVTGPYILNGGVENGTVSFADGDRLVPTGTGGTLSNITLNSNLLIPDGATLNISNGMTLNAKIRLLGATATTTLNFLQENPQSNGQTLGGSGTIVFGGTNSAEDVISSGNLDGPIIFGPGIVIEGNDGSFVVGDNTAPGFTNNGVIEDDVPGGTLVIPGPGILSNNGVIEAAPGTIDFSGSPNETQGYGAITIGIGGTVAGTSYGQIVSQPDTGPVGNSLYVALLPGFTPTAGQTFQIISGSSQSDSFNQTFTQVGGGDGFNVAYGPSDTTLTATTGGSDFADVAWNLLTVNGTNNADTIALDFNTVLPAIYTHLITAEMNGTTDVFFANQIADELVMGNGGNDSIVSSVANDTLEGNAGDDTIIATGGYSTLLGGGGNDSIGNYVPGTGFTNDGGNDSMRGGGGSDTIFSGTGNNVMVGGTGNDVLTAQNGGNTLAGGSGNDTITGGTGNDCIIGGLGTDSLVSGSGIDTLDATNGLVDTLSVVNAGDSLIGVVAGDSVSYAT